MPGLEQHSACVWLAVCMAAGLFVVVRALPHLTRWFGARPSNSMIAWADQVERSANAVIESDMRAAENKATHVELVGKIPDDFNPTIWLTCRVSEGTHRAVLVRALEDGRITEREFERVFGATIDGERLDERGARERREERESDAPPVVDEVRRRRSTMTLMRRDRREEFSADPFGEGSEPPASLLREKRQKERPAVPCGWSEGKLVPIGRSRRASA